MFSNHNQNGYEGVCLTWWSTSLLKMRETVAVYNPNGQIPLEKGVDSSSNKHAQGDEQGHWSDAVFPPHQQRWLLLIRDLFGDPPPGGVGKWAEAGPFPGGGGVELFCLNRPLLTILEKASTFRAAHYGERQFLVFFLVNSPASDGWDLIQKLHQIGGSFDRSRVGGWGTEHPSPRWGAKTTS